MILRNVLFALSLLGFVAACGGPGGDATVPVAEPAEATSADIGGHVVHFNAQSTDALSPEIARANDIARSKDMAMLTVSVLSKSDNKPVAADVKVKAVNLTGQLKNISLRKADVPDAIYYIGTVVDRQSRDARVRYQCQTGRCAGSQRRPLQATVLYGLNASRAK